MRLSFKFSVRSIELMWERNTVLMLNPNKGTFSEIVKIAMSDIEHATKGKSSAIKNYIKGS